MSSITDVLTSKGLITPPSFLKNNVHYEVMMGSIAYGCSNDASDIDIYGFGIPPKDVIFPHLGGHIQGFGKQIQKFEQFQQHHVIDKDTNKEYDLSIYNIVKYFQLCMENNPNMIDSLFVPRRCILHSTRVGEMIRESRNIFLHKGAWHKFKGYAFSQLHKCKNKAIKSWVEYCDKHKFPYNLNLEGLNNFNDSVSFSHDAYCQGIELIRKIEQSGKRSKRIESVAKHGYDVKFAYHIVRLLDEVEQIMTEYNIDLERNREQLKAIRRGDWTLEQVEKHFAQKEKDLETLYTKSIIPHSPPVDEIKNLLLECLEEHYGCLDNCVVQPEIAVDALREIQAITDRTLRQIK
jgi:uncharacterized protein